MPALSDKIFRNTFNSRKFRRRRVLLIWWLMSGLLVFRTVLSQVNSHLDSLCLSSPYRIATMLQLILRHRCADSCATRFGSSRFCVPARITHHDPLHPASLVGCWPLNIEQWKILLSLFPAKRPSSLLTNFFHSSGCSSLRVVACSCVILQSRVVRVKTFLKIHAITHA